jgi:hypothetical protein
MVNAYTVLYSAIGMPTLWRFFGGFAAGRPGSLSEKGQSWQFRANDPTTAG